MSQSDEYHLVKRGMFYRPNAQGYTMHREEAGRFSLERAKSESYSTHGDVSYIKAEPILNTEWIQKPEMYQEVAEYLEKFARDVDEVTGPMISKSEESWRAFDVETDDVIAIIVKHASVKPKPIPMVLGHAATAEWCRAVDDHHSATEAITKEQATTIANLRQVICEQHEVIRRHGIKSPT